MKNKIKNLLKLDKNIMNSLNLVGLTLTSYGIYLVTDEKLFFWTMVLFLILAFFQVWIWILKDKND